MPDRLSLMLDSLISAVDTGLSFDGIVSVPEIGLEDYGHRPGLAGWLDDGVELTHRITAAISRFFHRTPFPAETPTNPVKDDKLSTCDSGIGSGDHAGAPAIPLDSPPSQTGEQLQVLGDSAHKETSPLETLPRLKRGREDHGEARPQETLPRLKQTREESEETRSQEARKETEETLPDNGQKLPSKQSVQIRGEPNVGKSSETPVRNEDATHLSKTRDPRRRDQDRTGNR